MSKELTDEEVKKEVLRQAEVRGWVAPNLEYVIDEMLKSRPLPSSTPVGDVEELTEKLMIGDSDWKNELYEWWKHYCNDETPFIPLVGFVAKALISHTSKEIEDAVKAERDRHAQTLSALATMWNQYCSNENGHEFMSAGEKASEILERYNLLTPVKGKQINGMCGNAEVDYPLDNTYEDFFLQALSKDISNNQ